MFAHKDSVQESRLRNVFPTDGLLPELCAWMGKIVISRRIVLLSVYDAGNGRIEGSRCLEYQELKDLAVSTIRLEGKNTAVAGARRVVEINAERREAESDSLVKASNSKCRTLYHLSRTLQETLLTS